VKRIIFGEKSEFFFCSFLLFVLKNKSELNDGETSKNDFSYKWRKKRFGPKTLVVDFVFSGFNGLFDCDPYEK
jgi:hypothetical protein